MSRHKLSNWLIVALNIIALIGVGAFFFGERKRQVEEDRSIIFGLLSASLERVDVAFWEWDQKGDSLWWSPALYELYGLEPFGRPLTYDDWIAVVHPEDVEMADQACLDAMKTGVGYLMNYRIVLPDGSLKWITESADANDRFMVGVCVAREATK